MLCSLYYQTKVHFFINNWLKRGKKLDNLPFLFYNNNHNNNPIASSKHHYELYKNEKKIITNKKSTILFGLKVTLQKQMK